MVDLVEEAMAAGRARPLLQPHHPHTGADGQPIPGTFASLDELLALAGVLGRHGRGVFETAAMLGSQNGATPKSTVTEVGILAEISRATGRPVSFGLTQTLAGEGLHRQVLELVAEANAGGARVAPSHRAGCGRGTTRPRPPHALRRLCPRGRRSTGSTWTSAWPTCATQNQAQLIAEANDARAASTRRSCSRSTPFRPTTRCARRRRWRPGPSSPAGSTPQPSGSTCSMPPTAAASSCGPSSTRPPPEVEHLLGDPNVVLGLADAGAHVGQIMDASQPTWFLAHWVRDRGLYSLEDGIARLTSIPADLFAMPDRGVLAVGRRPTSTSWISRDWASPSPRSPTTSPVARVAGCRARRATTSRWSTAWSRSRGAATPASSRRDAARRRTGLAATRRRPLRAAASSARFSATIGSDSISASVAASSCRRPTDRSSRWSSGRPPLHSRRARGAHHQRRRG